MVCARLYDAEIELLDAVAMHMDRERSWVVRAAILAFTRGAVPPAPERSASNRLPTSRRERAVRTLNPTTAPARISHRGTK